MTTDDGVRVLKTTVQLRGALAELCEWADEITLMYAWVSSNAGTAAHWRELPLKKVRRALVGIHFAQTEPWALTQLSAKPGRLKVVDDVEGVFHPKLIVGTRRKEATAIVGSSNFTTGGFDGNSEINLLLRGSASDGATGDLLAFVADEWKKERAFEPSKEWLAKYKVRYDNRPRPTRVAAALSPVPAKIRHAGELDIPWRKYYERIKGRHGYKLSNGFRIRILDHEDGSYLQEIDTCRHAFERSATFASMPEPFRRHVTGWGDAPSSGYFGRNGAAGRFKWIVGNKPALIGKHLDRIPLTGEVDHRTVRAALKGMVSLQGVGLGAATRLIAVKRPDLFVTLNNANRRRVKAIFGSAPNTVDGYLDLMEQIRTFPWYRAPQPADRDQQRVWNARLALLDALLYELRK